MMCSFLHCLGQTRLEIEGYEGNVHFKMSPYINLGQTSLWNKHYQITPGRGGFFTLASINEK